MEISAVRILEFYVEKGPTIFPAAKPGWRGKVREAWPTSHTECGRLLYCYRSSQTWPISLVVSLEKLVKQGLKDAGMPSKLGNGLRALIVHPS